MVKKFFWIIALIALTASSLWNIPSVAAFQTPTTYYVSPSGNDANAGTEAAPFKTLAKALSTLKAGNTLYIRAGTYAAPATGWQFANSGTASQPITITNYPGERAVLTADSGKSGNYIIKCLQVSPVADYIRIIGTDVPPQAFDGVTSSKGIVMTGARLGIAPAIAAYQCDNWEVAGVDFIKVAYGIFQRKVNNGNTSADRWYVHNNRVYEYYRESGMQFNGNGNRIENNEIIKATNDYNSTYGCQLLNLLGNNNTVRGNKLTRLSSTRCIGIFFEWDLADANLIENNVITGVVNGISFFGGDNNTIRNNQLSGEETAFVVRSWADGTTAYPCNFSDFMPLESDASNPDWGYMYPHDCRSKNNRFENNTVSGFKTFSTVNLPEDSNVFVNGAEPTATPVPATPTATNPPAPTSTNPPPPPAQTRMLIPLYTAPSNWGQVVSSNVGGVIDAIVNPNNGVGSTIRDSFVNGIASLRSAGIGVFGYVSTSYGTRNINVVKTEIDTWQQWYAPSGIFLDEADNTNDANKAAYYAELYNYIRSKGMTVIINPGAMTTEAYMNRSDAACIFESAPLSPIPYPTWGGMYPQKLCALAFGANREQMISFVAEAKGRFGYVYATSDTPGNPWDTLPDYLAEEAALIAGLPVPTNTAPATSTSVPPITSTATLAPVYTATATGIVTPATETTFTPEPPTPIATPTFTSIPPTLPSGMSVSAVVEPDTILAGETGLVSISLNGLPAEGVAGVEFTCFYAADQVSVGNVQIGQIFGADPVSAYNNAQSGSFIFAVAGSNGRMINMDGIAFTFSVTGLQPGSSSVECKAKVSRGGSLEDIASVPDSLTVILQSAPTATPLSAPMLAGQVIASKPVTISLFNPDATLAATATANPDGTFNLNAPAGAFTVVASAEGHLSAQGSVTLAEGATTTLAPIALPAGDIDKNNAIDQFDALTVGMNYNVFAPLPADLSNDGLTNIMDLEMLAENYRMAGSLAWQQP